MSGPNVFISHRHADKAIAQAVSDWLWEKSNGAAKIHCSSSVDFYGPVAGEPLNKSLKQALAESDVVLLIFTSDHEDWSYCMWECGVATDPVDQKPTKVVVLQCGPNSPKPYEDHLRVDARDLTSISGFVKSFLTSTEYFPDVGQPLTQFSADGKEVKEIAVQLHERLGAVLPQAIGQEAEERSASPYLRVEYSEAAIHDVVAARGAGEEDRVREVLQAQGRVVGKEAVRTLFGFQFTPQTTLGTLLAETTGTASPDRTPRWFLSLIDQLETVVTGRFPVVKWAPYKEEPGEPAVIPYVAGVRTVPATGALQVNIYFIPMSPRPVPVTEKMISPAEMFHKNLADTPGETIRLGDLLAEMQGARTRVPMLGEGQRPRFMVHKSMIVEYISGRAMRGDADVKLLTVHDLLVDPEVGDVFERTFATVDPTSDMEQAKVAMQQVVGCQDVFVTSDGTADTAVIGWLTNSSFLE